MQFSRHAETRRIEFGLWEEDVLDIMEDAELVRPSGDHRYPNDRRMYSKGEWTIVVADDDIVVTILRRQAQEWSH